MNQNNTNPPDYDIGTVTNTSGDAKKPVVSSILIDDIENEHKSDYQKYITGKPKKIVIRARIFHDND